MLCQCDGVTLLLDFKMFYEHKMTRFHLTRLLATAAPLLISARRGAVKERRVGECSSGRMS